jgi:hypothetical protein
MLHLLFRARRRRGARSVCNTLSAESLESRRLLAYTFTLADKTGVTGTGLTDYSVYAVGFASYNFDDVQGKAYGQNAYVLGSVGSPAPTPSYVFANLPNSANPIQPGGKAANIYPVKLDSTNPTFTLPDTIPVEGTAPAANQLPTGRIYVFMVPNSDPAPPSISSKLELAPDGTTSAGLGFTGFTPGANSEFAYEVMEFTANNEYGHPHTLVGGSLDIDWTSVDQFQFPFTMQATITSPKWAATRQDTTQPNVQFTYELGTNNNNGTSFTRNDIFKHYGAFTETNPAWRSLLFNGTNQQPAGILSPLSATTGGAGAFRGYFDTVLNDLYVNGPPAKKTLYLQGSEGQKVWQTAPVLKNGAHALALWNSIDFGGIRKVTAEYRQSTDSTTVTVEMSPGGTVPTKNTKVKLTGISVPDYNGVHTVTEASVNTFTFSLAGNKDKGTGSGGLVQGGEYPGSSKTNPVWWIYDPRALTVLPVGTKNAENQIFGATGAFQAGNAVAGNFPGEGVGTVLDMLNAAINRGIATSSGVYETTKLAPPSRAASLPFWETQTNFYPGDAVQNVYAAFFHTAMIGATPVNHPNTTAPQKSAAGTLMGLAYGFAQDEKPGQDLNGDENRVSAAVNPQFQDNVDPNGVTLGGMIPTVPDNVPITFTLGPWGTLSKVTVNAPLTFTVVENSQNNPFQWPASPVPFVDTAATALTVMLSVSGGTIAVNQQAASKIGLTVGTSPQGPTIAGQITALNTFFQTKGNVTYTPISGSLVTQTLTTSAVDALNNKAFATSTIDIVSTAAPVVTAPAVFTVNENTATSLIWPTSPVPFADASSSSLTVTLTVTGGSVAFNSATASAAQLTVGGSPSAPSIAGPIATLNTYFQTAGNVTYTPITGSLAGETLTTSAFDGSERGQATSTIKILAPTPPTPGAPTVTLTPGVFTTAVNTSIGLLFNGTPFADTGATPTTVFTVTMSTGRPANGTLAATPGSGVTVVTSGAGATFTGTLSALNTYFTTAPAKITYSPPANVQGTRTLSTVISGNGKTSSPAGTTIVIGTNLAPTVAAPIAFWVPEQGRMTLVWPRGLQPFSDRDSRLLTVTLSTDSPASVGSFAASRADRNVTVVTTGDVVQLTGRPTDLNRYFATAGRITYSAIGPSLQPRVLTVHASDGGGVGTATSAILVRARGPAGVPVINPRATGFSTPAGTPLVITYAQLVTATGATTANSRSVEFLLGGVSSGRLELWDGAKWVRVPATQPRFKEPILAPGGQIRWTPPARATGQLAAFRVLAWDGWRMSGVSQVRVNLTR